MSFFCFLWLPLFYLFWRCVTKSGSAVGGVWALLIGSVVALIRFLLGSFIEPGGFDFSRWLSACIDIVTLPALSPLLIYFFLYIFKIIPGPLDFTSFSLLWLIPGAAIRAVSWSSLNDPILLVLVPFLWTAIVVGIPFFITLVINSRKWVIAPASLAILIIPFLAASSYWAFYSHKTPMGFVLCLAAAAPMLVCLVLSFVKDQDKN